MSEIHIQTDNGSEFGARKRDVKTPGIAIELQAQHCYIPPGCCNANADVESFHATIENELFDLETFTSREDFFAKTQVYQSYYNYARPNFSKGGQSPIPNPSQGPAGDVSGRP